ncbi:hypothetical protein [Lactobacillus phage JNU_P1]|nr:hypothetical protein [Lactobacillus phage JNU_P1]
MQDKQAATQDKVARRQAVRQANKVSKQDHQAARQARQGK